MRNPAGMAGARQQTASLSTTTTQQAVPGTTVVIDVPPGHVAIVNYFARGLPNANTQAIGLWLDGALVGHQSSDNNGHNMAATHEVGPGRHRIAVGAVATSNAGTVDRASISWIIARRDA